MRRQVELNGGTGERILTDSRRVWRAGLRRVLEVAVICLILLATLSGSHVQARQPVVTAASRGRRAMSERRRPGHFRMLFIGASITAGIGAEQPSQAYPELVAGRVAKRGKPVTLTVLAHSGARVSRARRWRYPGGQNVVVVHLVTNDYLHATPIPAYRSGLETILRHLRRSSPHATLVCLGAWIRPSAVNRADLGPGIYDAVDEADCRSVGGHFIRLDDLYAHPRLHDPAPLQIGPPVTPHGGLVMVGGRRVAFHPSDAGHAAIAEVVYEELERTRALPRPTT